MATETEYLVGTASWTDPTLVKSDLFYPPAVDTAEARLRFYAERFNTVEVDSSYYTLLAKRTAQLWVERTPANFKFNIKAFALLTRHAADVARLPLALKQMLSAREAGEKRLSHPSAAVLDLAFEMFWSALQPLRRADKLGMLLFQFPPYFVRQSSNLDYLAELRQRLPEAQIAVEFRHPSWLVDAARDASLEFLRAHQLCFVSVDAPVAPSIVPSFVATTESQMYVRFHGKNRENWFKKNLSVAERYKYLYSERELAAQAQAIKQVAGTRRAYLIFNNCYSNFGVMNAATMAEIMGRQGRSTP